MKSSGLRCLVWRVKPNVPQVPIGGQDSRRKSWFVIRYLKGEPRTTKSH
jgi:hypothetical protein